jgi:glycosyltransferase involved in cell wall biosynthesis
VASNLPVLQEVVEDEQNGILTPAEDPVALAAAIERLLEDDRERALFGGRSIEVFNERFTLDLVQERMGRFYDDLVES